MNQIYSLATSTPSSPNSQSHSNRRHSCTCPALSPHNGASPSCPECLHSPNRSRNRPEMGLSSSTIHSTKSWMLPRVCISLASHFRFCFVPPRGRSSALPGPVGQNLEILAIDFFCLKLNQITSKSLEGEARLRPIKAKNSKVGKIGAMGIEEWMNGEGRHDRDSFKEHFPRKGWISQSQTKWSKAHKTDD